MKKAERFIKGLGLLVLSLTWAAPSTALGFLFALVLFPFSRVKKHRGMIVLYPSFSFSFPLGAFCFLSEKDAERKISSFYGHFVLSCAWGPFYLFVITIPNLLIKIPKIALRRAERGLSPSDFYPERQAAALAARFGE